MKKNIKHTMSFIKGARKRLGLSQEAFAGLVGVARYSVSDYETGRCQPSGALVLRIQQILAGIEAGVGGECSKCSKGGAD
jgi:transcriptional regulator with XRE-family HTH domain